jgi:hypothetical protein
MKKYMLFIVFLIGMCNYTYSQKRKVALVVTWQNDAGFWKAIGPTQLVIVGCKTEEEPIGYACGTNKKNLIYITHIDRYYIYALKRRLENSDKDARFFLAENGIQFDSNNTIDQIERDLAMEEAQVEQKIIDEKNRKQQLADQQAQQRKQENDAREKLRQQQQQEQEQAQIKNEQEQVRQEQARNKQAQADKETQRQQENYQRQQQLQQQQQQAARDAQRQREAQVAAQVNAVNKSSQTAINNLNKGAQDIKDMFSHSSEYYDNLRAEAQAKRDQQKQERIEKEEAEKAKKRELEEKYHREAEESRIRADKEAVERQNNRANLLEQFPEGFLTVPNNISANKLYFFFYSYDKSTLENYNIQVYVSTPFYIEKHQDGSWPSRAAIRSQITPLIPYNTCIINGYYSSDEDALQNYTLLVNSFSKLNVYVNKVVINKIIEKSLRNEESDYLSIKQHPNEIDCKLYLYNFPESAHTNEVKSLLDDIVLDNKWLKIKSKYDISSFSQSQLMSYGAYLFNKKDYEGALKVWQIYLALPLKNNKFIIDSTFISIKYYAGIAAINAEKHDDAITILENLKNDNYRSYDVYSSLSNEYKIKKDNLNYAKILKEGFEKMPKEAWFLQTLINHLIYSGNTKEALIYLNIAIEQQPNLAVYRFTKGRLEEELGNLEDARASFDKTIELDPKMADAYAEIGRMYYNNAVKILEDAKNIMNNREYLVESEKANGFFKEAIPFYEQAAEIQSTEIEYKRILKTLYLKLKMDTKYNAISKLID